MKKWSKAIAIGLCVCIVGSTALAEAASSETEKQSQPSQQMIAQ